MKTILITSFHPMISRNILRTDFFQFLKNNMKVVIVVPNYKVDYYKENFADENVFIEGVPLFQASSTRLGLFFKRMAIYIANTKSARLRKRYDYHLNRKLFIFIVSMVIGFIGEFSFIKNIVRWLDQKFCPKGFFIKILSKYQPDIVLSTDVQNENDVSLMQDARYFGIKIGSMVRSWDNLSLRFLRVLPDILFVGSEELYNEAIKIHDFPPISNDYTPRIVITGNPHYDKYNKKSTINKEEFFKSFGLPLNKKLILYAPVSDALIKENNIDRHVLECLSLIDASIIVRFPPEKPVSLGDFKKPDNMFYDITGQGFGEKVGDREIRKEDDDNLINELFYCDLVVSGPTSILLDAIKFDKPAIAVDFYPRKMRFFDRVWRYKDNHIQKLLKTNAVYYADNRADFYRMIYRYLNNPAINTEGRKIARDKWFSHSQGSCERLFNMVGNYL